MVGAEDDEYKLFHSTSHSTSTVCKGNQVSWTKLRCRGETPHERTGRWDDKERRQENNRTLGDDQWKRAGEPLSNNQIIQVQGSSLPNHNGSDNDRGNSQPFQPIILNRDSQQNWWAPLFQLQLSYRPWIKKKGPQEPVTVCLNQGQNYKALESQISKPPPGVPTKIFADPWNQSGTQLCTKVWPSWLVY